MGDAKGNGSDAQRPAAFVRVEGTLLGRPTLAAAAYLAANAQGVGERLSRLGNVALAAPFALGGSLATGSTATRATWAGVRGMGEDRLRLLCEEYWERQLEPSVHDVGVELVRQAKKRGARIVLISDNIDWIVSPIAEQLEADDLLCNRLEIKKGRATGRLLEPVVGSQLAGSWARRFASQHDIDLDRSLAYGASGGDSLLLSAIGQPCAVNPDRMLRRIARDHDWPVVDG
ncbi:MAG: HAD family hydrolase [Polyangiales bacterium]